MTFRMMLPTAFVATVATVVVSGCAAPGSSAKDYDAKALAMIQTSFRPQGQAKMDRLVQDPIQDACSSPTLPPESVAKKLEAAQLATIRPPSGGQYVGDWKRGERLAENGRGMTWTDAPEAEAGGNCYNCHELAKSQISYGTIGPSLYNYGKLRGVKNPTDPASAPIVEYTWGKLYNAKAYSACSEMPRFGHFKVLNEKQLQDLMAYLLDPKSPVNQ